MDQLVLRDQMEILVLQDRMEREDHPDQPGPLVHQGSLDLRVLLEPLDQSELRALQDQLDQLD